MKPTNLVCVLCVVVFAGAVQAEDEIQNIPTSELGKRYRLIGKLHVPLGEKVIVQGVVEQEEETKAGRIYFRPQRIMGSATQEHIQIDIEPDSAFSDWGEEYRGAVYQDMYGESEDDWETATLEKLPDLVIGTTYEMEGYEIGRQYWHSREVSRNTFWGQQEPSVPYFEETLIVYRAEEIEPLTFGPRDFTGRSALLAGVAVSADGRALMQGDGWVVVVDDASPWPEDIEGKMIETHGMYHEGDVRHTFKLIDGGWHLSRLADQLDRKVELRGRALSRNGVWWFEYRGEALYVENMKDLPGWTRENHAKPVIIRGVLDKATLPQIEDYPNNGYENMKEYFIVRDASWEPLDVLLAPERPMPAAPVQGNDVEAQDN